MNVLIVFAVIVLLIAVNGLYVAAEFSIISARRARLAHMTDAGNPVAGFILGVVEDPRRLDTFVSASQLGITVSSLLLGFYGQSRIMDLLAPHFERLGEGARVLVQSITATAILLTLTILQVILGELIPKNLALRYPEQLATVTARPLRWSLALLRPLIWFFNGSGRLILRLMGAKPVPEHVHVHSPEEIVMLVEESSAGGLLNPEERRLLINTLRLRKLTVRKVMVPRNHMVAGAVDQSCEELFGLLAQSPYSRLPLYDGNIDTIIGVIHLKDLISACRRPAHGANGETGPLSSVRDIMHPVLFVPDSALIERVMTQLQGAHLNLAIVVDEYGGTAGMITIEDLTEEIIGEFRDEFDVDEPAWSLRPSNRIRVRGDVLLEDLVQVLGVPMPWQEAETVGGLVLQRLGHAPHAGDAVEVGDITLRVDKVHKNGVTAVSFKATPAQIDRLRGRGEAEDRP